VDVGVAKDFRISDRYKLNFKIQAFNVFNHPSFDTPNNNVSFNPNFADPAEYGAGACYTQVTGIGLQGAYQCPPSGQLGRIQHTIGSPRFLQMALHFSF